MNIYDIRNIFLEEVAVESSFEAIYIYIYIEDESRLFQG